MQCPVLLMFNSVFRNHCLKNNYSYDFKCSSKPSLCFISPVLSVGGDILGKYHHPCCTKENGKNGGMEKNVDIGDHKLGSIGLDWIGQARCHRARHKTKDNSRMVGITQILNLCCTTLLHINKGMLTGPAMPHISDSFSSGLEL